MALSPWRSSCLYFLGCWACTTTPADNLYYEYLFYLIISIDFSSELPAVVLKKMFNSQMESLKSISKFIGLGYSLDSSKVFFVLFVLRKDSFTFWSLTFPPECWGYRHMLPSNPELCVCETHSLQTELVPQPCFQSSEHPRLWFNFPTVETKACVTTMGSGFRSLKNLLQGLLTSEQK